MVEHCLKEVPRDEPLCQAAAGEPRCGFARGEGVFLLFPFDFILPHLPQVPPEKRGVTRTEGV